MEARLVQFARLLRQNGVRVSPAELADAGRAAALVGVGEKAHFRAALRATLVKRAPDVQVFDQLFDLYFSGLGRVLDGLERGLLVELEARGALDADDLRAAALALHEVMAELSPLARAALTGERGAVARLLESAAREVDFAALFSASQLGFYRRRLFGAAGGTAAGRDLAAVEERLRARGLPARTLELVSARLRAVLEALEQAARRYAELELRARARRAAAARWRRRASPPFRQPSSLAWRRRCAAWRSGSRRGAPLARGPGAAPSTSAARSAANIALGGFPARLAFRRRRRERPDEVVLCDVSDSVRHVSRLMLVFLHTLQSLFTRVRSFVFVSDVGEVTDAFREERDVRRAADLATAGQVVSLSGNSNYGRAFVAFHERHGGAVTRRTTVAPSSATVARTITRPRRGCSTSCAGAPAACSGSAPRSAGPGGRATARCPSTPPRWSGWRR